MPSSVSSSISQIENVVNLLPLLRRYFKEKGSTDSFCCGFCTRTYSIDGGGAEKHLKTFNTDEGCRERFLSELKEKVPAWEIHTVGEDEEEETEAAPPQHDSDGRAVNAGAGVLLVPPPEAAVEDAPLEQQHPLSESLSMVTKTAMVIQALPSAEPSALARMSRAEERTP